MQNSQNPWPIQVDSVILHASGICLELLIEKDLSFCLLSHPPSRDAVNKLGNRQDAAVKVWGATQTLGSRPLELVGQAGCGQAKVITGSQPRTVGIITDGGPVCVIRTYLPRGMGKWKCLRLTSWCEPVPRGMTLSLNPFLTSPNTHIHTQKPLSLSLDTFTCTDSLTL